MSPSRRQRALPALAVLSGVAALVYQALWVKQLTLVVGIAVHAVALGVSAFFAGLGAGSVLLGRLADRSSSPWRLLAGLEGGIALSAVAATLLLSRSAGPFVALADALGPAAHLLPALLVGAPALLMGGTLPALVRAAAPPDGALGRAAGGLYAWNTLGGALGVLLVPFALLPAFGVRGSALAAAALNLAVAAAAWRLAGPQRAASGRPLRPLPWPRSAWPALAIYAAAGALALGYEVAWTQLLAPLVSTRTFAFAIVLATYLLGLVLGSALHARVADRVRDPWAALGALLAGAAISAAGLSALVGPWLPAAQAALGELVQAGTGSVAAAMLARFALAAVAVLLLPCILLGAAFPAAVRLVARADAVGRGVGWTAGLNTAGGILGSLVTGFVLVPWLGAARALGLLALAGGALGAAAILRGAGARRARLAWACGLIAAAAAPLALTPPDASARLLAATRGGRVEFQAESVAGTVAVLSQRAATGDFRRLYIAGVSNSGDVMPSRRYMRLQALLPLVVHRGEPRTAMVVALGTGITCGALLADESLERRTCVELLPEVVEASRLFEGNLGAPHDPRIDLRIADGRHELLRSDETWDVITLEPPPPSAAGVVNLYSRDFYALCRRRLAPGGLLAQWWPLATQNDEDSRSLVRSVLDVFPHVTAWTTELHEVLLVASVEPIELDGARIARRFASGGIARVLAEVGVESPAALLATYVTGRDGLERYVDGAPPVTDDRPLIEHARWLREGEFPRVLRRLEDLVEDPPLRNADAALRRAIHSERSELRAFHSAGRFAYQGDRAAWAAAADAVLRADPDNPYYLWLLGARLRERPPDGADR